MSTLSVRFPNSLHAALRKLAKRDGKSINQIVNSTVAEKLAVLMTEEYLAARARLGNRAKFGAALKTVPAAEPEAADRLPDQRRFPAKSKA